MAEHDRPTVRETQMYDALTDPPTSGSKVWALQHGGSVVPVIVTSDFLQFYDAWYPYLKVPAAVKARQLARFNTEAVPLAESLTGENCMAENQMESHTFQKSDNVVEARHDGTDLYVRFHHGGTYRYPAAASHFHGLVAAESAGSYVHKHLKPLNPTKVN